MKVLSKEEEQHHYNAVVQGGILGGVVGTAAGALGVWAASRRFPTFRSLTIPFRAFLVVSVGTFASIVQADRSSLAYEYTHSPERQLHADRQERLQQELESGKPAWERARDWAADHRYGIVGVSWLASMAIALGLVRRNPYLTGKQKLVQSRVYAQGLTIAVLLASFAFEANDATRGKGRWETVTILDPNDPDHKRMIEKKIHHERYAGEDQWRDMVEAEEQKIKAREEAKQREASLHKKAQSLERR